MQHKNLAPQDSHSPSQERVENNTGSPISALKGVRYTGIGTLYPSIEIADATSDVRGLTQSIIQDASSGYILSYGFTYNIDTSAWAPGTSLFIDNNGDLTDVSLGGPQVANVLKQHATLGVLAVTCLDTPAALIANVQDTDSIDMDTVGSAIKSDLRLSANAAAANHEKAITTVKSGPSKGLHVEYPWADTDTNGILTATDWNVFFNRVQQTDPRLSVMNVLKVKKNPGTGEFLTIAAAIAAASAGTPNATNRYAIHIAPGIYTEAALVVPSYVYLIGYSMGSVVVEPDANNHHVIQLSENTAANFLSVRNAGPGFAGIFIEDSGENCIVHKVDISDSDYGLIAETSSGSSDTHYAFLEYVSFENCTTRAILTQTDGAGELEFRAENLYIYADGTNTPVGIDVIGDVNIGISSGTMERVDAAFGDALWLSDTSEANVSSLHIENWEIGILVSDSAVAKINSTTFENNTVNIDVDSAAASGFFNGYSEYEKVTIDPASSFFLTNKDANTITVFKKGGDFASVKAAVDSITGASASNRYTVLVGPGIFVEDTIVMKEYVDITGASAAQTIIQVDGPNKDLVHGIRHAELNKVMLTGVSGTGYALVRVEGQTGWTNQETLFIRQCTFGSSDVLVVSSGDTGPSTVFVEGCSMGDGFAFVTGFIANNVGSSTGRMLIRNSTTVGGTTPPYPADMFIVDGPGSEIVIASCLTSNNTAAPAGNGLRARNGGRYRVVASSFRGYNKALLVENVGAAPILEITGTTFGANITDIQVDHPSTTGFVNGSAALTKTLIASTDPQFTVNLTDPEDPGLLLNGKLNYSENDLNLSVDIAPLITNGGTMGVIDGGELTDGGGLNLDVAAGFGYLMASSVPTHVLNRYDWISQSLVLPASQASYIYVNTAGNLVASPSAPYSATIILLGRVVTDASSILYIESAPLQSLHYNNQLDRLMREALGPVYASGSITTEVGTRQLQVTSGKYYFSEKQYLPVGGNPATWDSYYRSASPGVYTRITAQNTVSNTQYDNGSGTLASIPAGEYAKHALWILGGPSEKYLLVYAQQTYPSQAAAETAPLPTPPGFVGDSFARLASVIVQEGVTNIVQIVDERPRLGFTASGTSSTSSHSALSDLANDDHLQYLRTDGGRTMTGDLNLGGNAIVNVGNVDGVDISAHASRHLPNNADPITTAAPLVAIGGNTVNEVGTANSLARSDHQHDVVTGVPVTQSPDAANAEGVSNALARADHVHNIPAATAVGLSATTTNAEGASTSFARANHTHAIASGAASSQIPDQANATGTSANFARADHVHNIATAAPITVNADGTNTQGAAATFSRADHKHNVLTGTPSAQAPDQANAEGTSSSLARADHIHNIPADAPTTTLSPATTNAEGVGVAFARNDHTHAIATGLIGDVTTIEPDAAASAGTADRFARADHRHAIDTATAVGLTANSTNTEGVSTSFARADHTHDLSTGPVSTQVPDQVNAEGTSPDLARADHTHSIPTAAPITVNADGTNTQGVAATFARSDHKHNILTAAPVTQTPDQANAAGSSSSLARADHVHNIPADAPTTTLSPATANAEGAGTSFARNDHTHAVATGLVADIVTIQPDATASAGVIDRFARADHRHAIDAAAPSGTLAPSSTNTEGVSTSFARADHTHALATGIVGDIVTINPDDTASAGTADRYARADHRHAIAAAAPSTNLSTSTTNAEGVSTSFARADHTHAVETGIVGDITTIQPDDAAAAGTAIRYARADHRHAIVAAAASSIATNSTNTEGASTSFARADHTHAVTVNDVEVSATAAATTTSGTDVLMTGMTTTPAAGRYLLIFSCWVTGTTDGAEITASVYVGGSQLAHTEREVTPRGAFGAASDGANIATNGIVTVNGAQAVEIRWRRTGGTATVNNRTMNLIRLSN